MDVDAELVHGHLSAPGLPVDDEPPGTVQPLEDGVHAAAQGGGADGDLPVRLGLGQDVVLQERQVLCSAQPALDAVPVLGPEAVGHARLSQAEQGAACAQALGDGVVEDGSEPAGGAGLGWERATQVECELAAVGAQVVQAGGGQVLGQADGGPTGQGPGALSQEESRLESPPPHHLVVRLGLSGRLLDGLGPAHGGGNLGGGRVPGPAHSGEPVGDRCPLFSGLRGLTVQGLRCVGVGGPGAHLGQGGQGVGAGLIEVDPALRVGRQEVAPLELGEEA